jgi:hypothetical protein
MRNPRHPALALLRAVYPDRLRPAAGALAHPFVDPGTGYEDLLWDWDAFFCLLGLEKLSGEETR